jgi:PAS domain S-box-containing protein
MPGCAAGEEAYSVAMLLLEGFELARKPLSLKIFATDSDPGTIEVARRGIYPEHAVLALSSKRRERFFVPAGARRYQVASAMRERLVFGLHDLLADPPISNLDLIVYRQAAPCGDRDASEGLDSLWHFALKPSGYLLLSAAAFAPSPALFEPVCERWPLFRRNGTAHPWLGQSTTARAAKNRARPAAGPGNAARLTDHELLDGFAAATILMNPHYRILAARGAVAKFLKFPARLPAPSLLVAAGASLRSATRSACERAQRSRRPVRGVNAWVRRNGCYFRCRVSARVLRRAPGSERLFMVTFDEDVAARRASDRQRRGAAAALRESDDQLRSARAELQATVADLERANQNIEAANEAANLANAELRGANEALQATNEELRAANDELESSKAALQERTDEIERVEGQLRAMLDATADAVVTTDAAERIVTFNRSAARMFAYAVDEVIGRKFSVLLSSDPGDMREHRHAGGRGGGIRTLIGAAHEVMARRRTGTRFPALLSVSEAAGGELLVCCLRDLTLDRALQREVLSIATLEQQRIGQELHDGLQQELIGLGLLAQNLADDLARTDSASSAKASRVAAGLAEANLNVRSLARGLVPVPVDAETLPAALSELAKTTQETCKIDCRFECAEPVNMPDAATATHLYRIAQEAVGNAVKHASSRVIRIRLMRQDGGLRLEICDDGVGVPALPAARAGVGLRLMEHRCALIGGRFALESRSGGGTVVSCSFAPQNAS